jgi:hypothetical protein
VAVTDPEQLTALEQAGFELGQLVANTAAQSTRALNEHAGFRSILRVLRDDVVETKRRFPLARPTSVLGFRQFDPSWLDSPEMSFDLVGVFNRLDRKAFYTGTCGEIRFVYRLRYETTQGGQAMRGRLPLSINVVFLVDGTQNGNERPCADIARAWQQPKDTNLSQQAWLRQQGALTPGVRRRWSLKAVETNLQTIRLQSTVHTSLAGHIEYSLRVFRAKDDNRTEFFEAALENMPDVEKLKADPTLRTRLLKLLKDPKTLADVDRGTLLLPEQYLAKRAISVSPRALTRLDNRPFRRLFEPSDFADVNLSRYRSIASPAALLRRLDGASCTGCHQSRSIAGFHHVGLQTHDEPVAPTLLSGSSMHLEADLERRRQYVAALSEGKTADEFRPLPERQGAGNGFGAPCGLGDPGFAHLTCDPGLTCNRLEDGEVGTCLPDAGVGMPCEHGVMQPGRSAQHDRVREMRRVACAEQHSCDLNVQGFPLGACAARCDDAGPGAVCGQFLDVDGYQNCLRQKQPNAVCAEKFVFKTGFRKCDAENRCRQDYVCVRTEHEAVGACVPPYFVYALRNDGYPLKR